MKKLILNSILFIGITACSDVEPTVRSMNEPYDETNGEVKIEAELPNTVNDEDIKWYIREDKKSNSVYIRHQLNNNLPKLSGNALVYNVKIKTPSKYRVWAHVKNDSSVSGNVIIGIDGKTFSYNAENNETNEFFWLNENASFRFDTGLYKLHLWIKQENVFVDKLLLTNNERMRPNGNVHSSEIQHDNEEIVDNFLKARKEQKQLQPLNRQYGDYSLSDAYELQEKLADKLKNDLGEIVGYKLAFATASAMEKFNLNEPVYGPLFEKQRIENGDSVGLDEFMQFHIENEIAFVTSEIRKPVESVEDLKNHVKSIHLGFDMADGRFDRSNGREGINDFVASGGGGHRFALGKAFNGINHNLVDKMLLIHHDKEIVYEGNSNNAYENPWKALLWVVNDLIENGHTIKDNMIFLTGKVDSPYTPEGDNAKGKYTGTCDGFPDVICTVK